MSGKYTFHGSVFSGTGRGGYYVGHPEFMKRFEKVLGYAPYPGTLNLRLSSPEEIEKRRRLRVGRKTLSIEEFQYRGETFSAVGIFRGRIGVRVADLLVVRITHYDDSVLELISPVYLRGALGLADGSSVSLEVSFESRRKAGRRRGVRRHRN